MRKYLTEYRRFFANAIASDGTDLKALMEYHLQQIAFFQHERLIHLIVMLLVALLTMISIATAFITAYPAFVLLTVVLLCLLVPYIMHYFFLENQVQYMYDDYNRLYIMLGGEGYQSDTEKKYTNT